MALADGRLVPHGKHSDLHRRAINAMEGRPPRNLRVKWVPSKQGRGARQGGNNFPGTHGRKQRGGHVGHSWCRNPRSLERESGGIAQAGRA
eukprot:3860335-Heterocapsa_arctica.AAC.1